MCQTLGTATTRQRWLRHGPYFYGNGKEIGALIEHRGTTMTSVRREGVGALKEERVSSDERGKEG